MKLINFLAFILLSLTAMPSLVFADASPLSGFGGLMPLIFIFIFFYLFLLRPQQKKAKDHQALLNTLKKDDKIITSGGIYACVVSVEGSVVKIKIAEGVNIQIEKQSISAVNPEQKEDKIKVPEIVKR
ncbi:MAG: preprotein translocase subunit YajC [Endomicrobium sp.]|jgi:preprotein translocase subunit YajC|nr:preprotein translocase subunit YajC [Endomicrobium sp.]